MAVGDPTFFTKDKETKILHNKKDKRDHVFFLAGGHIDLCQNKHA